MSSPYPQSGQTVKVPVCLGSLPPPSCQHIRGSDRSQARLGLTTLLFVFACLSPPPPPHPNPRKPAFSGPFSTQSFICSSHQPRRGEKYSTGTTALTQFSCHISITPQWPLALDYTWKKDVKKLTFATPASYGQGQKDFERNCCMYFHS